VVALIRIALKLSAAFQPLCATRSASPFVRPSGDGIDLGDAEDLCFADASGFSRTFKREFGYNLSELRSAALPLRAEPRSRVPSSTANFGALLRRL
jgi:hypothetical protein